MTWTVRSVRPTTAAMSRIRAVGLRATSTSTCPCPVSRVQLPALSSRAFITSEYILARPSARESIRVILFMRAISRNLFHVSIDRCPPRTDAGSARSGPGPGKRWRRPMTTPVLGTADVLVVEDDPGDVLLTTDALEDCHLGLSLHVVGDGEEAMRFLRSAGQQRPALVLLDLNLPRRGGLEVLADLKADPDLRAIPVVVLTTSQAEADIARSYELHANAYVIKPIDAAKFADAINQIDEFFLSLRRRPQR